MCLLVGLRNRPEATRQIFILPMACSAAIRLRLSRLLPRLCRLVSRCPGVLFTGVHSTVPW